MPVPKNKEELIDQSASNFKDLLEFINNLNPEIRSKDFKPGTMNRNIRDVLAHLHHWHKMFIGWYKIGMTGTNPDMPAKGYTWRDTKKMNEEIWQKYLDTDLQTIKDKLVTSHGHLHEIMESHSNEELFEKKRYAWTGSSSLATYIRSNTSSHYRWALNLIKKGIDN